MSWELITVEPTEYRPDDSGLYVLVHRQTQTEAHKDRSGQRITVRVDVMNADDEPIISFQGIGEDVRKHLTRWIALDYRHNPRRFSLEHAAYIGAEIQRAELDPMFIQS